MQDIFVKINGISYLYECLTRYAGKTGYLMIYFCAVIGIIIKGTKKEKQIFIPLTVLMVFTVYNPLFPLIISRITDIDSEYYRFFWITPVIVLVPYVMTKLIYMLSETEFKYKPLFIAAILIAFLSSSAFIYNEETVSSGHMHIAENIYKMPDELITICEIIHDDCDDEYPKAFFEYEYNMQIRQYDPKMLLTIDRDDYLYAVNFEYTQGMIDGTETLYGLELSYEHKILAALVRYQNVGMDMLLDAFDKTNTEYIVMTKGSTMIDRLKKAGLSTVATTENHVILKYALKNKQHFELIDYSGVYREGL